MVTNINVIGFSVVGPHEEMFCSEYPSNGDCIQNQENKILEGERVPLPCYSCWSVYLYMLSMHHEVS